MFKERNIIIKLSLTVFLVIACLFSTFVVAPWVSSPEFHAETIETLEEKKNEAMMLTTASAVASTAISMLPNDAATPIADQLADLSKYLLLVTCMVYLEKFLLTTLGAASFSFLIPAACIVMIIGIWINKDTFKSVAMKLAIFGIAIFLVVPSSVKVTNMIEATFQESIDTTFSKVEQITIISEEEETTDKNITDKILGFFNDAKDTITTSVSNVVDQAKNVLSVFIDAIAVLIITSCLIPVAVFLFFIWLVKILFGITIPVPKFKGTSEKFKGNQE